MIERVSRYYDGPLSQVTDAVTDQHKVFVYRKFPSNVSINYLPYIWKASDELPLIANHFKLGTKFWWEIADINPDIIDMFNITPGTEIRIPYGN